MSDTPGLAMMANHTVAFARGAHLLENMKAHL